MNIKELDEDEKIALAEALIENKNIVKQLEAAKSEIKTIKITCFFIPVIFCWFILGAYILRI